MVSLPSQEFINWFVIWTAVWVVTINIPPGSKAIPTAYRLNFLHGLLSSLVAVACLLGYVPVEVTTPCTLSYFAVDFINIILNDFVHKVPSYQSPGARKVEYCHHILCFFVGMTAELRYKELCNMTLNPFVKLMFAEFSTPFLILWRNYDNDILGGLFVLAFIACRLIYHGLYFIPECARECHPSVGYGFGIPYTLMNLYFFAMIARKMLKPAKKSGKKNDAKEGKKSK
jgi:hypothetical protein